MPNPSLPGPLFKRVPAPGNPESQSDLRREYHPRTTSELMGAVEGALERLYLQDHSLIRRGVREESVSHRLAQYLQTDYFSDYDVDCEYNKNLEGYKVLPGTKGNAGIRPDIIVHWRGHNQPTNLIMLELKIKGRDISNKDVEKVRHFVDSPDYRYQLGAAILIENAEYRIQYVVNAPVD